MSSFSVASAVGWGTLCLIIAGCADEREKLPPAATSPVISGLVVLSTEQQAQLGLATAKATQREVSEHLTTTGWLETVPGWQATVKAPVAGFVTAAPSRSLPRLGDQISQGDPLVSMQVFLTPQEIVQLITTKEDVDIALQQSQVSMQLAEEQLKQVQKAEGAVVGTRINDLREIYERAKAAYRESQEKLPYLADEPYNLTALVKPVEVKAPQAGRVVEVHVADGQFVLPGDPLWVIADWSRFRVRVPVFEGDLARVRMEDEARVRTSDLTHTFTARPDRAPLSTTDKLRTVDLFYELANPDGKLRSGQAVTLQLPTAEIASRWVVPNSAVLWDGMGNTWIYVRAAADSFRRQRVELGPMLGSDVVVSRGVSGEEEIVTVGAESLYGQEFKGSIQAEDND